MKIGINDSLKRIYSFSFTSRRFSPIFIPIDSNEAVLLILTHFFCPSTASFQQIHNLDLEVFFVLCLSTIALINLFVYCYFGKIGTDSFASMPDSLYVEMNWRNLKPKLQMYVVLMIRNMQKPVFYSGFSVTVMDLNTFIRVLNCSILNLK